MFAVVPYLKLLAYKCIYSSEEGHVLCQERFVAKAKMVLVQVLNTVSVSPQNSSWYTLMCFTTEMLKRLKKSTHAAARPEINESFYVLQLTG